MSAIKDEQVLYQNLKNLNVNLSIFPLYLYSKYVHFLCQAEGFYSNKLSAYSLANCIKF